MGTLVTQATLKRGVISNTGWVNANDLRKNRKSAVVDRNSHARKTLKVNHFALGMLVVTAGISVVHVRYDCVKDRS